MLEEARKRNPQRRLSYHRSYRRSRRRRHTRP